MTGHELDLLTPDLDGIPIDDTAEPSDADVDHTGPGGVAELEDRP